MEVKLVLDCKLLQSLDEEAMKLHPGNTFEFRVKILKNSNHQITMSRSQGDRYGYMFFVQGEAPTFSEACSCLVKSFIQLIELRLTQLDEIKERYLQNTAQEQEKIRITLTAVNQLIPS